MPAGENVVPWLSNGISGALRLAGWAHMREGGWHGPEKKAWKITRSESGTSSPSEILQGCLRRLWQSGHCPGGSARGERSALYGVLQEIEMVRMLSENEGIRKWDLRGICRTGEVKHDKG